MKVPGPEGRSPGAFSNPLGSAMSRPQETATGRHPSGALLCQICGASGALVATHGPDVFRRRQKSQIVCSSCSSVCALVAERFRLTLTLRPIDARSLSDT